ncbi:MAG: 16S rRNA (uracil(1498)-N(3))-methyltransferase [Clostridiales bacterium]|nr:16S rRNA (uracil(1498)-N(3))-methyltransferase [Clostridiales bacterium]
MYHFFIEPDQVHGQEIEILGGDVNHMKNVLRMRTGEEITVSDGFGHEYLCRISGFTEDSVLAGILEKREVSVELPSRLVLFQCLPKGDKMELIIQKAVELGAAEIVPVASRRCVVKLDAKKEESKRKRWQAIAESAAKQSGRAIVPKVQPVMSFSEALVRAGELDVRLIPYECADELLLGGGKSAMEKTRELLEEIKRGQSVGVFIGPEGGLEKAEVESAMKAGAKPVTLGKRILRTETAGLCILSVLMFRLEE